MAFLRILLKLVLVASSIVALSSCATIRPNDSLEAKAQNIEWQTNTSTMVRWVTIGSGGFGTALLASGETDGASMLLILASAAGILSLLSDQALQQMQVDFNKTVAKNLAEDHPAPEVPSP